LLKKAGFATKTHLREEIVWLPTRGAQVIQRVRRILAEPNITPLV
jgi:hypothetical protein